MSPIFTPATLADALASKYEDVLALVEATSGMDTVYRDQVTIAWLRDNRRQAIQYDIERENTARQQSAIYVGLDRRLARTSSKVWHVLMMERN